MSAKGKVSKKATRKVVSRRRVLQGAAGLAATAIAMPAIHVGIS